MKVVYGYGIVKKLAILYAIYLILYIREIINYKYLDDVKNILCSRFKSFVNQVYGVRNYSLTIKKLLKKKKMS